jgi:hypothetical protein
MTVEVAHKVSAAHLSRTAYLYVRQSTLRQVLTNTESAARQYALRQRNQRNSMRTWVLQSQRDDGTCDVNAISSNVQVFGDPWSLQYDRDRCSLALTRHAIIDKRTRHAQLQASDHL